MPTIEEEKDKCGRLWSHEHSMPFGSSDPQSALEAPENLWGNEALVLETTRYSLHLGSKPSLTAGKWVTVMESSFGDLRVEK